MCDLLTNRRKPGVVPTTPLGILTEKIPFSAIRMPDNLVVCNTSLTHRSILYKLFLKYQCASKKYIFSSSLFSLGILLPILYTSLSLEGKIIMFACGLCVCCHTLRLQAFFISNTYQTI